MAQLPAPSGGGLGQRAVAPRAAACRSWLGVGGGTSNGSWPSHTLMMTLKMRAVMFLTLQWKQAQSDASRVGTQGGARSNGCWTCPAARSSCRQQSCTRHQHTGLASGGEEPPVWRSRSSAGPTYLLSCVAGLVMLRRTPLTAEMALPYAKCSLLLRALKRSWRDSRALIILSLRGSCLGMAAP